MNNPFEPINARLNNLEALTLEVLQLLRSTAHSLALTDEPPLSVQQAAEFLNISKQTVYQNIDKIPHSKRFGRLYFYASDLRAYLENGKGGVLI